MKVLIVDDNCQDRGVLRLMLLAHGCSVREADNGRRALEEAAASQPDLIISDALMPEMDGFRFLREAKGDPRLKEVPFIFYSAVYTGRDEEKLALSLGAEAFLVKPLEPELLWQKIQQLLTRPGKGEAEEPERPANHQFLAEYSHVVVMKLEEKVRELEKTQDELRTKQQQLEELNRSLEQRIEEKVAQSRQMDQMFIQQDRFSAMGEMLNNIAHQWRQPLNNVALMVQNLRLEVTSGTMEALPLKQQVDMVLGVIQGLSQTIENFRTFFHREGEEREFKPSQAISEVMGIVGAALRGNGVETEIIIEEDAPVRGHYREYCRAILNIIDNAKEVLLERKTDGPQITIRIYGRDGSSIVAIADNGGGMEDEVAEKIFDPYFTTKFQSQGKGLCLYMSKVIIERNMGGRLTARNIGSGTELTIALPLDRDCKGASL